MARRAARHRETDSGVSPDLNGGATPWLLLVHQLPARPPGIRVKIWRRLRQLGAVAVKSSVYVLPNRQGAREDFEWVRAEIAALGGQATVFQASTVEARAGDELRELFRRARDDDYRALTAEMERYTPKGARSARRTAPGDGGKAVRDFRERLVQIEATDYFAAAGREAARTALAKIEALAQPLERQPAATAARRASFQRRVWMTRPRPGIDRIASAWLIRRFLDPAARFAFGDRAEAQASGAVSFDMFEGDFTHVGDRCTFEVLCARFGLRDPVVAEIGQTVHDLDLKDGKFGRSAGAILGPLIEGLQTLHADDADLLERGMALFEAWYAGSPVGGIRRDRAPRTPPRRSR
jgi:hypothetical protein